MINKIKHSSLSLKLRFLITTMIMILAIVVVLFSYLLIRTSNQYSKIIQNLATVSEFSQDFKTSLDYKMYQYVAGRGDNFDQLDPLKDIQEARTVINKLKDTTYREDSKEKLRYITNFLKNLEDSIIDIRDHREYDSNMMKLDNNVRILTTLITENVNKYMYYESNELAKISVQVHNEITQMIGMILIASLMLISALWLLSVKISDSITKPIKEIVENIKIVGSGDFKIRPIEAFDDEIQTLSFTFDHMVSQISNLMVVSKNEQIKLRQTELKLLQAQINPHFLYNTFDTIIWLAEGHRDQDVVDMVTSLSNFFRTGLSQGEDLITLKEEGLHVRSYLEIQQFRYRDILDYEIEIPDTLDFFTVPKLTLQPLVENALYHGIKNKRGKGLIKVIAEKKEDELILKVSDNGIGMTPEQAAELRKSASEGDTSVGFGLHNVLERIHLYYGEKYGFDIESQYQVGTTITVNLPLKNELKTN